MIRVIQALLPIFKEQAIQNKDDTTTVVRNGRIINVISMAGIISGTAQLSGYHASKHAAQAYSECVRTELLPTFQIYVTTINPSFHTTNIVDPILSPSSLQTLRDRVFPVASTTLHQQYGTGNIWVV
jgi:short-subunit dehydrogenase